MISIPENIQRLKSYPAGPTAQSIASQLGLPSVAALWNNENHLGPSPTVALAIAEAAAVAHLYPDPQATDLRRALADTYACQPNEILFDHGSESLLDHLFRAFVPPAGEVLCFEHSFAVMDVWALANGRTLRKAPLAENYRQNPETLLSHISPTTSVVYVCNTNNPTGTYWRGSEFEELLNGIPPHVVLVVDEAYFEYSAAIDPAFADSFEYRHPQVISLRTFSKAYGLAGLRIGYALGSVHLMEQLAKVRMTFAPSVVAQRAALAALADSQHLVNVVQQNALAVATFSEALRAGSAFVPATAANFVMADFGTVEKALNITQILYAKGVLVKHLATLGLPSCIRVSTGTPRDNEQFLAAFGAAMGSA